MFARGPGHGSARPGDREAAVGATILLDRSVSEGGRKMVGPRRP